jgi:hypothetical protein
LAAELPLHPRSLRTPKNLVQGVPANEDLDKYPQNLGDMEWNRNTWHEAQAPSPHPLPSKWAVQQLRSEETIHAALTAEIGMEGTWK